MLNVWYGAFNDIARSEPQLAYAAYTFGLSKRWLYIMRTLNDIQHIFQPLEDCIKNSFLPTFIKHHFNELDRAIFSLPAKFGGLGIFDPTKICQYEYQYSREATAPLATGGAKCQYLAKCGYILLYSEIFYKILKDSIKFWKMRQNATKVNSKPVWNGSFSQHIHISTSEGGRDLLANWAI